MFCKHCGETIDDDCVVCPKCGKQVAELNTSDKSIIINNSASSSASASAVANNVGATKTPREKNKWIAFCLCFFLGYLGVHKFYEGKILFGVIYLLTLGLFGIGWFVDCILLLLKPNPYYV